MERSESTQLLAWGRSFSQVSALLTSPTAFSVPFRVREVACGDDHCLLLAADGRVFAQGQNNHGALGISAPSNAFVCSPVLIEKLRQKRVASCACGPEHSLCVAETGELFAWGVGEHGVLGLGDCEDRSSPAQVRLPPHYRPSAVSAGARHTAILCEHAGKLSLLVCGLNLQGQLGLGHFTSQRTFVEMPTAEEVEQVACGFAHTLLVSRRNLVYATGGNSLGQLGLGHRRPTNVPTRVSSLSCEVVKVAAGSHSAALTEQGELYVWGTGPFGTWLVPQKYSTTPIRDVDLQSHFGVAIDAEQWLWTWGSNNSGQLGLGDFRIREALTKTSLRWLKLVRLGGASVVAQCDSHSRTSSDLVLSGYEGEDVSSLRKTITALESELRTSYKELSTRRLPEVWSSDQHLQQLEATLTQQFELNDQLSKSVSNLQVTRDAQEQEMLSLARELEVKDQQADRLRSKYKRLKDAYTKLKVQNQLLLRNYKEELGYRDRLKADLQGLEAKLEQSLRSHADHAQLQQCVSATQAENHQLRKELDALKQDNHALEQRLLAVLQDSDSLKTELLRSLGGDDLKSGRWTSDLEPIEEADSTVRRSSVRRYMNPLQSSMDVVNFAEALNSREELSPLQEGAKTEPPSLASSFPDKSVMQPPLSLRSSLSELSGKSKDARRSRLDGEWRKSLVKQKTCEGESG